MSGYRERIAYFLLKEVTRAIGEFALIEEGDEVAVAVSGGKDSRAMLDLLLRHRRNVPYDYHLLAIHVVGTEAGLPDLRPDLEPWLERLGVDHRFVPLALPPDEPLPLNCFRCSWNRRKTLFTTAVDLGCKKLALGHHADDAAVTTLMNLMFNGKLETMEPRVVFFDGAVTVIRPLIYLTEKELIRHARAAGHPDPPPCPWEAESKRGQIEALLRQLGHEQGQVRTNLWRVAREAMGF
ncbi:MAG: ATP-binding protein [Anaerolineae bacterium]|jgi:tRNA(Ile)-lysidine synthase TilS/MesJ